MEFKINPLSFSGIFAVPNRLVDENIKLAGPIQLKALLYLLRHGNEREVSVEEMAKALCVDKEDISDAMLFWSDRGLVLKAEEVPTLTPISEAVQQITVTPVKKEEEKPLPVIHISKPSHQEVASRLKESEDLALFFQQAQASLGKPIGYEGQSTLLMMHDGYGLPLEVIIMAIEHCVSQKKYGLKQIATLGKRWSEMGIDTIEGVNDYIQEHEIVDEAWEKLRTMTDISNRKPTEKQRKFIVSWTKELSFSVEMIYFAYEESIDHTGKVSMNYMDTVLRNWHKAGVKTATELQKYKENYKKLHFSAEQTKNDGKKKDKTEENEASYDIGLFMQEAVNLEYIKSENN